MALFYGKALGSDYNEVLYSIKSTFMLSNAYARICRFLLSQSYDGNGAYEVIFCQLTFL